MSQGLTTDVRCPPDQVLDNSPWTFVSHTALYLLNLHFLPYEFPSSDRLLLCDDICLMCVRYTLSLSLSLTLCSSLLSPLLCLFLPSQISSKGVGREERDGRRAQTDQSQETHTQTQERTDEPSEANRQNHHHQHSHTHTSDRESSLYQDRPLLRRPSQHHRPVCRPSTEPVVMSHGSQSCRKSASGEQCWLCHSLTRRVRLLGVLKNFLGWLCSYTGAVPQRFCLEVRQNPPFFRAGQVNAR